MCTQVLASALHERQKRKQQRERPPPPSRYGRAPPPGGPPQGGAPVEMKTCEATRAMRDVLRLMGSDEAAVAYDEALASELGERQLPPAAYAPTN